MSDCIGVHAGDRVSLTGHPQVAYGNYAQLFNISIIVIFSVLLHIDELREIRRKYLSLTDDLMSHL